MQDVVWALFRGEFEQAERLAERALSSGEARRSDADCSYRLAMFLMRREQGRLEEIEALIRDAVDAYPGYRSFRCFIPLLELELGRDQDARRAFDALAQDAFSALPRDSEWLFCLCLLAEVAAGLDDRGAAEVLYGLLAPYSGVNAMAAGEVMVGPVARFLGILADGARATRRRGRALRGRPRDRGADRGPPVARPHPGGVRPHAARSRRSRRRRSGPASCSQRAARPTASSASCAQAASGRTGTPASASASLTWAIE